MDPLTFYLIILISFIFFKKILNYYKYIIEYVFIKLSNRKNFKKMFNNLKINPTIKEKSPDEMPFLMQNDLNPKNKDPKKAINDYISSNYHQTSEKNFMNFYTSICETLLPAKSLKQIEEIYLDFLLGEPQEALKTLNNENLKSIIANYFEKPHETPFIEPIETIHSPNHRVSSLFLSPDSTKMVTGNYFSDSLVGVWEVDLSRKKIQFVKQKFSRSS